MRHYKRGLLVILCIPLWLVIYYDCTLLYRYFTNHKLESADQSIRNLAQRLEHSKNSAHHYLLSRRDILAVIICLTTDLPSSTTAMSTPESAFITGLSKHVHIRRDTVKFHEAYLNGGQVPVFEDGDAARLYSDYLHKRRDAREVEVQLRELVRRPQERERLLLLLEKYNKMPGSNRQFTARIRAESDKNDLVRNKLKDVKRFLDQSLFPPSQREMAKKEVHQIIRDIEGYLQRYGNDDDLKSYSTWAEKELQRWIKARDLLSLADEDLRSPANEVMNRIGRYKHLIQSEEDFADFRMFVSKIADHLCSSYLPEKIPLDDKVILPDLEGKPTEVSRNRVDIVWKKDKDKPQPLNDPMLKYNEVTLGSVEDDIAYYLLDGAKPRQKPIRATPKSRAAHEYNIRRKEIRWTVSSVEELRAACQPYREILGETCRRIEHVMDTIRSFPELFDRTN